MATLLIVMHAVMLDAQFRKASYSFTVDLVKNSFQADAPEIAVNMAIKGLSPSQICAMSRDDVLLRYYRQLGMADHYNANGLIARAVDDISKAQTFEAAVSLWEAIVEEPRLNLLLTGEGLELIEEVYELGRIFDLSTRSVLKLT
jgi:hypothetical protein